MLLVAYLDLGDRRAAEQVAGFAENRLSPRCLWILMDDRQWQEAGEVAYASLARSTETPQSVGGHLQAIRMHARATGDFDRAEIALTNLSGVHWTAGGTAVLPEDTVGADAGPAIALADILFASGQEDKGRRLLIPIIERLRHEVGVLKRPEFWYRGTHPVALALSGDREATLAMLERAAAHDQLPGRGVFRMETDPAFAALRAEPRFQAIVIKWQQGFEQQRKELDRMRAEGLVPDRSHRSESPPP
jgi:hypothetical protein